jgi:hypothetical protein
MIKILVNLFPKWFKLTNHSEYGEILKMNDKNINPMLKEIDDIDLEKIDFP